MQTRTPLPVTRLEAETTGDRRIHLTWAQRASGAEEIRIERRSLETGWTPVALLPADQTQWTDPSLNPSTVYEYRLFHRNRHGDSDPSTVVEAETWSEGVSERTEDFAPADAKSPNRLGLWKAIDSPSPPLVWNQEEGSSRDAAAPAGFWSTGSVPIRQTRILLTENVQVDLSAPEAQVRFDMQAWATTVFSPMFQLQDGTWVIADRRYDTQRRSWKTLRFDLHNTELSWWRVDPLRRTREAEPLQNFRPEKELQSVTGLGVFIEWVINRKTISIDQFTVRGRWQP
jgi:hypothetical protein